MAESFSREKLRHAPQKEGGREVLCDLPSGLNNVSVKFGVKYRIRSGNSIVFQSSETRLIMA